MCESATLRLWVWRRADCEQIKTKEDSRVQQSNLESCKQMVWKAPHSNTCVSLCFHILRCIQRNKLIQTEQIKNIYRIVIDWTIWGANQHHHQINWFCKHVCIVFDLFWPVSTGRGKAHAQGGQGDAIKVTELEGHEDGRRQNEDGDDAAYGFGCFEVGKNEDIRRNTKKTWKSSWKSWIVLNSLE